MDYMSVSQITRDLKNRISSEITRKEVLETLRELGYIDKYNRITDDGLLFYREFHDMKGRRDDKWEMEIVNQVGDVLFEKYFP